MNEKCCGTCAHWNIRGIVDIDLRLCRAPLPACFESMPLTRPTKADDGRCCPCWKKGVVTESTTSTGDGRQTTRTSTSSQDSMEN